MPRTIVAALGESIVQSADVVARSVALLMADKRRHGELVYSAAGKFLEMENGTAGFHALTQQMLEFEEDEMEKLLAAERRVENVIDNMSEKDRQHHTNRAPVTME